MPKKMETKILTGILVLAAVCMSGSPSYAAINFTLTITPSTINFPDANPTTTAQIPANSPVAIKVTTSNATNTNWSVHFLANGDLRNSDGTSIIPIARITWTASQTGNSCLQGCSCVAGTMSSTVGQDVIKGRGNTPAVGGFNCNASFLLGNQWGYNTGSYTQTITVVTSSP